MARAVVIVNRCRVPLEALMKVLFTPYSGLVPMAHAIHASVAASVTELKRNPMGTMAAGMGGAVAILNRNEPAFYCIPAAEYEAMLDMLEDAELNAIADARANSPGVTVTLDEL